MCTNVDKDSFVNNKCCRHLSFEKCLHIKMNGLAFVLGPYKSCLYNCDYH